MLTFTLTNTIKFAREWKAAHKNSSAPVCTCFITTLLVNLTVHGDNNNNIVVYFLPWRGPWVPGQTDSPRCWLFYRYIAQEPLIDKRWEFLDWYWVIKFKWGRHTSSPFVKVSQKYTLANRTHNNKLLPGRIGLPSRIQINSYWHYRSSAKVLIRPATRSVGDIWYLINIIVGDVMLKNKERERCLLKVNIKNHYS